MLALLTKHMIYFTCIDKAVVTTVNHSFSMCDLCTQLQLSIFW